MPLRKKWPSRDQLVWDDNRRFASILNELKLDCEKERHSFGNISKKLAAPKGVPERSPSSVLTGPCDG